MQCTRFYCFSVSFSFYKMKNKVKKIIYFFWCSEEAEEEENNDDDDDDELEG